MTEHKTPWTAKPNRCGCCFDLYAIQEGAEVALAYSEEARDEILLAVNSHDELIAMCEKLLATSELDPPIDSDLEDRARAIIAKAKGGKS